MPERFVPSTGIAGQLATRPLPVDVPPIHVDLVWHRRQQQRPGHRWLRDAIAASAGSAFERRSALAAG